MITNDIQQLLDGSLSDDQAAELLHTLSVSPEKRVAFQQHIALAALMAQDRASIGLSSNEQSAIWGNITGAVGSLAATSARSRGLAGWLTRGAALLAAGVVGYLLGAVTIVSPTTADVTAPPASPRIQSTGPAAAPRTIAQSMPVMVRDSIIYRERIVYRDRDHIVYRDRPVSASIAPALAATSNGTAAPRSTSNGVERSPAAPVTTIPAATAPATNTTNTDPRTLSPRVTDTLSTNGGGSLRSPATTPAPSMLPRHDSTPDAPKPPRSIAHAPEVSTPSIADMPIASAFSRNGWEVSVSERVGMLLPAPEGIDDPDGKFNYRNADVAYRFGEGRYSVGGRLVYGTFSAFSLEPDASSSLNFVDATPSLQAEEKFWVELFAGYRFPLTESIAIGAELSAGGSRDHRKIGGDLVVVAMLTDQIGIQAGGGFGRYWYDLAGEREKLFNQYENVGIRATAREAYDGPIIEGRYGLFFHF
jgi:hypothetical protein